MRKVFKIATVTSCLVSFCYGNVSAAEDSIIKEQEEVSRRVAEMAVQPEQYQNWQAYAGGQEASRKQKLSKHEQKRRQGKQEAKGKAHMVEENTRARDIFGWYTDSRVNVKYTEAKQIKQLKNGGWLYAYIHPSLTNPQWENALDKGLAARAKGQNGIKVLESVIELKINDDARLYTTKLHKNDRGDYIAILDTLGGHKEISRKANKSEFEVRDCGSTSQKK
jgi:hypothetical protein